MFIPSSEQQAIFDWFFGNTGNLAISALAGTGKTTTLLELAKKLKPSDKVLYCAFNKSIADEVQPKLVGTPVIAKTFHALGLSALKRKVPNAKPDGYKYNNIVRNFFDKNKTPDNLMSLMKRIDSAIADLAESDDPYETQDNTRKIEISCQKFMVDLVNMARLKLTGAKDTDALYALAYAYDIVSEEIADAQLLNALIALIPAVLDRGEELAKVGEIDFTDMIYWVVKWRLVVDQFDLVMADECQDLSPMQRELVGMAIKPSGRIVLVGDPNQAIYRFAGADANSFELSVAKWSCKVLPLTMTRRCAQVVVYHSQNIVPYFVAHEASPRGKVVWIDQQKLEEHVRPGDMILCRLKAPLVSQCLYFLSIGKSAKILGSDIGQALEKLIDRVNGKHTDFDGFGDRVNVYRQNQLIKLEKMGDAGQALMSKVSDECDALVAIWSDALDKKLTTFQAMKDNLKALFSDEKGAIILATGHKSKGLEADRVFILTPEKLPLVWKDQTQEQAQQESNLDYVIRTRAKRELVYVTSKKYREDRVMPSYAQDDFTEREWQEDWDATKFINQKEVDAFMKMTSAHLEAIDKRREEEAVNVITVEAESVVVASEPEPIAVAPTLTIEAPKLIDVPAVTPQQPALPLAPAPTPSPVLAVNRVMIDKKRDKVKMLIDSLSNDQLDAVIALLSAVKESRAITTND